MKNKSVIGSKWSFLLVLLMLSGFVQGQEEPKQKSGWIDDFSGTVSVTHNGISLVPSFSLGDPAMLFDLKFRKGRFSFEPDMRFALEGKPWSFLFWMRYKAVQKERFSLRIGMHPALNFRTVSVIRNGEQEEIIESRRFLAGELAPSYALTDNINVGMYYLYSRGLDDSAKNTHFLVANMTFDHIAVTQQFSMSFSPQVYYLKQDHLEGVYAVAFVTLAKQDFPLSVSAIFNKAIDTEILPEKDFVWNVSLVYRFK